MQLIYVVRHGETDANVKGQVNDRNVIIPLNANGKSQATKTGKYFKKACSSCIIYSSPSVRAVQTATLIAKELTVSKVIQDDRINEADHGILSGSVPGDAIDKKFMKIINKLSKTDSVDRELAYQKVEPTINKNFKTESREATVARVKSFLKSLPKKKNIIIVTHRGIIQGILTALFNVIAQVSGDTTNGKNCSIMGIRKDENKYQLLTTPNTIHLKN